MAAKGNEQAALPAGEDDKKQKKSSRGKRIIILLIVLLTLAAVGGGGYWWLYMRGPAAPGTADAPAKTEQAAGEANAPDGKKEAPQQNAQGGVRIERQSDLPRSGGIVVPLPSITVNLVVDMAMMPMGDGVGSYAEYAGTAAYDELENLVISLFDKIDAGSFASMAEIEELGVALDKTYSKMVSASLDFSVASKDEPMDVTALIVNPEFESQSQNENGEIQTNRSAEGWVGASVDDGQLSKVTSLGPSRQRGRHAAECRSLPAVRCAAMDGEDAFHLRRRARVHEV